MNVVLDLMDLKQLTGDNAKVLLSENWKLMTLKNVLIFAIQTKSAPPIIMYTLIKVGLVNTLKRKLNLTQLTNAELFAAKNEHPQLVQKRKKICNDSNHHLHLNLLKLR